MLRRSLLVSLCVALAASVAQGADNVPAVLNFKMNSLAGKPVDLSKYKGNVVLMVNVASECGLTPQYEGLEALHKKFAAQGLSVLGFPANEFGAQEPGSNEEIATFCKQNYGVDRSRSRGFRARAPQSTERTVFAKAVARGVAWAACVFASQLRPRR